MTTSTENDEKFVYVLYHYTPTLPGAIVAFSIFAILTSLHLWRLIHNRARYFIAFTIGGVFQLVGYGFRIWSHFNKENVLPFAMQNAYILLAPALYAASIYMILGRLIRTCHAEHLSLIRVEWVTRIFVGGDIAAFSIQASGGSMAMSSFKLFKIGEKVVIAGLFVQVLIFGFFVCTTVLFHRRILSTPTEITLQGALPWQRHLYVLYSTSGIILVRSIFRIVEYMEGNGGFLVSHEVFLYIFDTLLMIAVMGICLVWYVGDLESKKQSKERYQRQPNMSTEDSLELGVQPQK
ncbi:Protein RTA1-like protein 2 [Colletotrichum truncatum]|uniref:Protein RTA1-like protein 2 n=1 Tax=Colletotrichum truncatum TaxID=5467 RepID=A0ACC3YN25_COLTU|nr:Protein RTA1-like protein 2 [Colletotrichum truncatum]KAF6789609.1 Protein RTA1-like protein 2 [Colletotrichum truncatum]